MERKHITIWDLPTRIFHWLLVVLFIAAVVTVKIGMIEQHAIIGICLAGLLFFRILWGFVGSDTARFVFFLKGPTAILEYLKGRYEYLGHNPLGALMVITMILLLCTQITLGLFSNDDILFDAPFAKFISPNLSDQFTIWHHRISKVLIGLAMIHIFAVLYYVFIKRENIILEMISGNKFVAFIPVKLPLFVSFLRTIVCIILALIMVYILFNI